MTTVQLAKVERRWLAVALFVAIAVVVIMVFDPACSIVRLANSFQAFGASEDCLNWPPTGDLVCFVGPIKERRLKRSARE